MCIELILDDHDLVCMWKMNIYQFSHTFCPICFRTSRSYFHVPPILERSEEHEQIGNSFALVFVVISLWFSRLHGQGLTCFSHQLLWALIEAHHWALRVNRTFVDIQNIFHMVDELRIRMRWNAPLLLAPRFQLIVI